jgi:hypothetical protein
MAQISIEECAQNFVTEVLAIGHNQAATAVTKMELILNSSLRFYSVLFGAQIAVKSDGIIQHGPFAGLRCIPQIAGSAVIPRLLGSYEAELHDTIYELVEHGYERVINIGCGEGYYAVGLAKLLPKAHVFALDPDREAQDVCRSLAELNAVADRVTILGKCTPSVLRELAHPGTLIFCDCEGDELELLDPIEVPVLSRCDILVELHDFVHRNIGELLAARFKDTHSRQFIPQTSRDTLAYPILEPLSDFERLYAVCEFRPGPTPWALFLANPPQPPKT